MAMPAVRQAGFGPAPTVSSGCACVLGDQCKNQPLLAASRLAEQNALGECERSVRTYMAEKQRRESTERQVAQLTEQRDNSLHPQIRRLERDLKKAKEDSGKERDAALERARAAETELADTTRTLHAV